MCLQTERILGILSIVTLDLFLGNYLLQLIISTDFSISLDKGLVSENL